MSEANNRQTSEGSRKRSDAAGDFFAVGTPLQPLRASYIRRPADELLFEAMIAGRFAHVIAPDQSGKTSLISATAARLENNGVAVAILDLEQLGLRDGGTDAGRFYYSVAYRILRQLRIRFELQTWWQDKSLFSNRQRLHEFYSEVVLGQTKQPVAILVDEIQCVEHLPFTDQLLTSIRSAHDARTTDPEFTRLTFALCGECDPATLVKVPEHSPFQVTQSIPLRDFTRRETDLFATELNLSSDKAATALDRIHYWANGQPYLTQKLSRAIARDNPEDDVEEAVDGIVLQQFTGRASLTNEPLLNHVHRRLVDDPSAEQLLNLYGRIRKGVEVPTDLGSPLQRRLIALGLLAVNERGDLEVRNRIYADVFTARWANENLPLHWRAPLVAALVAIVFLVVPFWYTQMLPRPYVAALTETTSDLETAETAWLNLRSFPGHSDTADSLYRLYIEGQARAAASPDVIDAVLLRVASLPDGEAMADQLLAGFRDREVLRAVRYEERDRALMASLEALVLPTPERRRRVARLIADDYPELIATHGNAPRGERFFNADALMLSDIDGSAVSQWTLANGQLEAGQPWQITALEVTPLVRRVIVDQEGAVRRAGLTLNLSHARHNDLRIKIIAPSGKTIEIETGRERSSNVDDLRIDTEQLAPLIGESLNGTWSLSVRDEGTGVAGHLVGWNLTLNSQGLVEDFQRGLDIPDPVEVDASNVWISGDGRYAVARATQSDSARVWDMSFGKPVRAIALNQSETLIGLDNGARRLLTATIDSVNLWDTATGDRLATLPIAGAGIAGSLSEDGRYLFLNYPGDEETRFELWSLDTLERVAELTTAGSPALVALAAEGRRLAVADFDRSVRVWNLDTGELAAQLNLAAQPSSIYLSAGGDALGAVYGRSGLSLWALSRTNEPLFEFLEPGDWKMAFAPSGTRVAAGRPATGFRLYHVSTGRRLGPAFGLGASPNALLAFSRDESTLLTGASGDTLRFWRVPPALPDDAGPPANAWWQPSPASVVTPTPDARKLLVGDNDGHLNILSRSTDPARRMAAVGDQLAYLGHRAPISHIAVDAQSLWAASVADDSTLRVWSLADGLPKPWTTDLPESGILDVEFSPDGHLVAVLSDVSVRIYDRATGEAVTDYGSGGGLSSLAFMSNDALFVGGQDGVLRIMRLAPGMAPDVRPVWQGESALTHIAAGAWEDELIVVDADHVARVLSIAEGQVARLALVLPGAVREVRVAPSGPGVLFRTDRWVHRAISGVEGLAWRDAMLVPASGNADRIVFDSTAGRPNEALIVSDDSATLALRPLDGSADEPGVFGSREDLLRDWRRRLAAGEVPEDAPD